MAGTWRASTARQDLVTIAEVVVHGGSIALLGGSNDLGNGHVVDAPLGEEASGGIEKQVARGQRLSHVDRDSSGGLASRVDYSAWRWTSRANVPPESATSWS